MKRPEAVIEKVVLDLIEQYSQQIGIKRGRRRSTPLTLGTLMRNPAVKESFLRRLRSRLKTAFSEQLNDDQLRALRSLSIVPSDIARNTTASLATVIADRLGLRLASRSKATERVVLSEPTPSRSTVKKAAPAKKSAAKRVAAAKKSASKKVFRKGSRRPPKGGRGGGFVPSGSGLGYLPSNEYEDDDLDEEEDDGLDEDGGRGAFAPGIRIDAAAEEPNQRQRKGDNTTLVRIFYSTDRKPEKDRATGLRYSAARSATGLNFGECEISIPKLHKTGQLESPSILKLEFRPNPKKHIVLAAVTTMEEQAFLAKVAEVVSQSPKKEAFIFIHGYNVTFEDAARRTGQFAFDLKFAGAPILYSWPSNGNIADYPADENNAIWTVPNLTHFLSLLVQHTAAKKIHIIAHSMGNRAVCDALNSLSAQRPKRAKMLLHHLVLAAPDIDADVFKSLASALTRTSGHVTLYASSRDKAIKVSRLLHKNPRAGALPIIISPPIESIDASSVRTDFFSHGYFGDSWPVLNDIYELVGNDRPAAERFALLETTSAEGGTYYVFKP